MNNIIKIVVGAIAGIAVGALACVLYGVITKNNIVEKIKEAFAKRKTSANSAFAAMVKEIQKDSVNVDVFFGDVDEPDIEEIEVKGVAKGIQENEWISLLD